MSKTRVAWIRAQFPEIDPSISLVTRRAMQHYVRHLESILLDPDMMASEQQFLKAAAGGDQPPWKEEPDFAGNPTKTLSQWVTEAGRQRIDRFLQSDPFGRIAYLKGVM